MAARSREVVYCNATSDWVAVGRDLMASRLRERARPICADDPLSRQAHHFSSIAVRGTPDFCIDVARISIAGISASGEAERCLPWLPDRPDTARAAVIVDRDTLEAIAHRISFNDEYLHTVKTWPQSLWLSQTFCEQRNHAARVVLPVVEGRQAQGRYRPENLCAINVGPRFAGVYCCLVELPDCRA